MAANIIYYSIEFEKPRLILRVLKNLGSKVTNQIQGKFPERSAYVCNVVDSSNFATNLLFASENVIGPLLKNVLILCVQLTL